MDAITFDDSLAAESFALRRRLGPVQRGFSSGYGAVASRDKIRRMIPYFRRLKYAFRTFFSILDYSRIPDDVVAAMVKPREEIPKPVAPSAIDTADRATQVLALLQRDGRLVDFLMEELDAYPDAQVGAAVRDVHAGCRQCLSRYLTLSPVLDDEEGRPVTIERDADPARIKLVGNVVGQPPFRGVLRHRGWDATRITLPPLPETGRSVIAPAEVEIA
jgi:hypothetical protein